MDKEKKEKTLGSVSNKFGINTNQGYMTVDKRLDDEEVEDGVALTQKVSDLLVEYGVDERAVEKGKAGAVFCAHLPGAAATVMLVGEKPVIDSSAGLVVNAVAKMRGYISEEDDWIEDMGEPSIGHLDPKDIKSYTEYEQLMPSHISIAPTAFRYACVPDSTSSAVRTSPITTFILKVIAAIACGTEEALDVGTDAQRDCIPKGYRNFASPSSARLMATCAALNVRTWSADGGSLGQGCSLHGFCTASAQLCNYAYILAFCLGHKALNDSLSTPMLVARAATLFTEKFMSVGSGLIISGVDKLTVDDFYSLYNSREEADAALKEILKDDDEDEQ